jgi:hypothetical protein
MCQRQLKTLDLSVPEITSRVTLIRRAIFTVSSEDSWPREVISLMEMELVAFPFTEPSSLMRASSSDTTRRAYSQWLTLAQTPTALNSFSPLPQPTGKNSLHLVSTYFDRLDGYHVVFGELIDGENILTQLELAGTRNGKPTAKIVIEDCGQIKDEAAK